MKEVRTKLSTTTRKQTKGNRKTHELRYQHLHELCYQHLVEDSLGLICVHDLEGKLLYVNPTATKALGYEQEEWQGKNLKQFLAPSVRTLFPAYLERIRNKAVDRGMMIVRTKTGEEKVWMYQNARYDHQTRPSYVLGHAIEVTKFVADQMALHTSVERFRGLIEHSSEMIVVLDAQGVVRYESPSAVRVLGYPIGESIGKSGFTFVHPEDLPRVTEAFSHILEQSESVPLHEARVRHRDGSWRTLEFSSTNLLAEPAIAGIVVNSRDITHRKQIESALQRSAERLDALHEISRGIIAAHSPEAIAQIACGYICRFISCVRASIAVFDAEQQQALVFADEPKGETALTAGTHLPLDSFGGISQLRQGKLYEVKDLRLLAHPTTVEQKLEKEGMRSALGIPLLAQGELIGVMYILSNNPEVLDPRDTIIAQEVADLVAIAIQQRSLHERVSRRAEHLEQEVLTRTAELRDREKLAATGRMAARIAHEINNPLAGIKNAFRLIKDAVPATHPHQQYVSRIDKEIDRIAGIVRQMFDLYQTEPEKPQTFCLDETILDVIALLEPSWRQHGVHIIVNEQQPGVEVRLPEGAVREILFNLLVNAIEASPQNGKVEVQVTCHQETVQIEVADQGKGIPQDAHKQIFEPFFTTKDGTMGRGLGLGLSISKSLVEGMQGRIEFRSRPEQGMIFLVTLPQRVPTS